MARYVAVDIGSNSVRMQAAEVLPGGGTRVLASDRDVTRLGASVFSTGRVSAEAMKFVCQTLARMADTYGKLDIAGVRAVATSAVRDAANQQEFIERASEALGSPVETISGQEEARLIHLGVQSQWPHPDRRMLIIDVGGGSAEIILSDDGELVEAFSKPLGAVRLTEAFLKNDPPQEIELHRMNEYIDEKLAAARRRIGSRNIDRVIATSASAAAIVSAVHRIPRARRETADRLRVTRREVRSVYQALSQQDLSRRRKATGIGPRRAEIIIAGAAVFLRALEGFERPSLYYSTAGVRDGIIADLAIRGVGRERSRLTREQRVVVEKMARRYGVSVPHARQVGNLTGSLFDGLAPLHSLPAEFGRLLEAAAFLHDVGHYVSDVAHHKHSYYLVVNADMPSFTKTERTLIAMLCRYHRKAMPADHHEEYRELSGDSRKAVLLLAPLLRIADSLDRSHDQRVDKVACQLRGGSVVVQIQAKADTDLEQWASERAADVFREVYGRPLSLVNTR